jgi:hypothetical protein
MAKLLVPKVVSYNGYTKRGYAKNGTKAFVPQGTRLPRGLKREEKWLSLRRLAEQSDFFIKPLSNRNKRIRLLLNKYGIETEKIVQELGGGKALFGREGISLSSFQGKKLFRTRPEMYLDKITGVMAKMLLLEITHGHPHPGNFAITPSGKVIVLDLGLAQMGQAEKIRQKARSADTGSAKRAMKDVHTFVDKFAIYYCRTVWQREPTQKEFEAKSDEIYGHLIEKVKQIEGPLKEEIKRKTTIQ